MTTELAAIVMAHQDPEQVRRLIGALEDVPIALHCDSKAPADVAATMVRGFGARVAAVPRSSGALDSWSLVRIELSALRVALRQSSARHIVVLSGADYPLLGTAQLVQRLQAWEGRSCVTNEPLPFSEWNGRGGRWRTDHRFWTRGDDVVKIGRFPLRDPWRRRIPTGLEIRASSQWKVYSREDAERLLAVIDQRPDLVRFWRSTLVPDESFVASVLSSPHFTGGPVLPIQQGVPWFTRWGDGAHHPRWLDAADYTKLRAAMERPPAVPVEPTYPDVDPGPAPWFARKLSSAVSGDLLDLIDSELREAPRTTCGPSGSVPSVRLLYVTDDVPNRYPVEGDGSSMISYEFLTGLDPEVSVTLVTFDRGIEVPPEVRERCAELVVLPLRSRLPVLAHVLLGRLDFNGAERSTRLARRTVTRLSAQHDVTFLHGPQLTALARAVTGPLVLQSVDPWSLALKAGLGRYQGLRLVFRRRKAAQVAAEELTLPTRARLLTVGSDDARAWADRLGRPVRSVGNGVDVADRPPRSPGPPVVCFVGSLSYPPNVASAQILVGQVAPLLWQTDPDIRIVLAGRRPSPEVLALAGARVEVRPNVPSITEVFHSSDLAAFPDDAGLGVRNSVTEALAAGLPVVATSIAAREQLPHPLLHVVDEIPAFAERMLLLLDQSATAAPAAVAPQWRTWRDVVAEYEAELDAAVEAAPSTRQPR